MQENTKSVVVKMTARRCFRTEPIWQYDVGHELIFEGFNLPAAFEVHFSRSSIGKAITQIGTNDVCTVPDMFAQNAGVVYAWLYIAEEDTGLTKFSIEMPVQPKAKPTDQQPAPVEQSAVDQAIAALNAGVEAAEDAQEAAEAAQASAESYAESAGQSAITATNAASAAASAKTAAETAARNAATSATDAHTSREAADQSATNAGVSERAAASSASAAAGSATSAAASASQASGSATAASGSAGTASTKASEAAQSATAAAGSAASASEDAGTASTAATAAEASATAAAGSATAAAGSATSAGQSATAAAGSAQTAQDVLDSIPADYSELTEDVNSLMSALGDYILISGSTSTTKAFTCESGKTYIVRLISGPVEVFTRETQYGANKKQVIYNDTANGTIRIFAPTGTTAYLRINASGDYSFIIGEYNSVAVLPYYSDKQITDIYSQIGNKVIQAIKGELTPTNKDGIYSGINNNIVGMIAGRAYPAYVKNNTPITISTSDGSVFDENSTLRIRLLGQNKSEVDYFLLKNGESSRTVQTNYGDAYYLTFSETPNVPLMVNYGSTALPYEPYLDNLEYITELLDNYEEQSHATTLNLNAEVVDKIRQAKKCRNNEVVPLVLAHISDIHMDETRLKRFIEFNNAITDIDTAICTGDMVNTFANSYSFWSASGAGSVLTVIGNHDGLENQTAGWYEGQASMSDAYNKFMSAFIDTWGVVHSGTNTYYYKDYSEKNIRLIVLDSMRSGADATAQNTWLSSVLADAKTNGHYVVIATHCVPETTDGINYVDCTFTSKKFTYEDLYDTCVTFDTYQQTVQTFINNGGKFICWICGHTHVDFVYTTEEYPDQLWVVVTCGLQSVNNDQDRTIGTKNEDAFNIISLDVNNDIIKVIRVGADRDCFMRHLGTLCINFDTKEVVFND